MVSSTRSLPPFLLKTMRPVSMQYDAIFLIRQMLKLTKLMGTEWLAT